MKIQAVDRINRDDLARAGDVPPAVDPLIDALNPFMGAVVSALQGRLTFGDNFSCKLTSQKFTHGTELTIAIDKAQSVLGAIPLLAASANVIAGWAVNPKGNGSVGITINFGAGGGTQASVTLLILYA